MFFRSYVVFKIVQCEISMIENVRNVVLFEIMMMMVMMIIC